MQPLSSLFFVSAAVRNSIISEFSANPGAEDEFIPFVFRVSRYSWELWVYFIGDELMFDPYLIGPIGHDRKVRDFIGLPIKEATCLI